MSKQERRLRHLLLKVEQAKFHLHLLQQLLGAFLSSNPYKIGTRREENRRMTYFVESVTPVPDQVTLLAGDVLQNLVSALDHLAFQLVCADTNGNPPKPSSIYFPIGSDQQDYEARKRTKLLGAQPRTLQAIDALKPYKGGNDALWVLAKINNIEKHRMLLAVGSQAHGIQLGEILAQAAAGAPDWPMRDAAIEAMRKLPGYLMPADTGFPLELGFPLFHDVPDAAPNPNLRFRFVVALDEPEADVKGAEVTQFLREKIGTVEGIVKTLEPLLA